MKSESEIKKFKEMIEMYEVFEKMKAAKEEKETQPKTAKDLKTLEELYSTKIEATGWEHFKEWNARFAKALNILIIALLKVIIGLPILIFFGALAYMGISMMIEGPEKNTLNKPEIVAERTTTSRQK